MTYFWRTTPLTDAEQHLLHLTLEAHAESAFRPNISSVACSNAAEGSGSYTSALTAALATLGGKHAPLAATYELLQQPLEVVERRIIAGERLPGWGNSFHKDAPDPVWTRVATQLQLCNATLAERLATITEMLLAIGKRVHPNPSAYTAAVAITLGLSAPLTPWLFVQGRLLSWSMLFNQVTKGVS